MANKRITELASIATLPAGTQFLASTLSASVKKTAATISFAAADKSINDSGGGFVSAGFVAGDQINVTGAAASGNNVFSATVTSVTAGKLVTNAAGIVTAAAGPAVTVARWDSQRVDLATLASAIGGGGGSLSVQTVSSAATVTPTATNDLVEITGQAAALTVANPSGSPANGWGLAIRIKDDGTARAITWGSNYRAIGVTLPSATAAGKQHYIAAIYNGAAGKWDVVSVGVQA